MSGSLEPNRRKLLWWLDKMNLNDGAEPDRSSQDTAEESQHMARSQLNSGLFSCGRKIIQQPSVAVPVEVTWPRAIVKSKEEFKENILSPHTVSYVKKRSKMTDSEINAEAEYYYKLNRRKREVKDGEGSDSDDEGEHDDYLCVFCRTNPYCYKHGVFMTHYIGDTSSRRINCPILRANDCPLCGSLADYAHSIKYVPQCRVHNPRRSRVSPDLDPFRQ